MTEQKFRFPQFPYIFERRIASTALESETIAQRITAAREREQTVRFAVSPAIAFVTATDGTHLRPGDEVTPEILGGEPYHIGAGVELGVFLQISDAEVMRRSPSPGRDRYRVGPRAVICRGVVFSPGDWIGPADFAVAAQPAVPEVPGFVDAHGNPRPGSPGRDKIEANDGHADIARLVAKGILIDTKASSAKGAA